MATRALGSLIFCSSTGNGNTVYHFSTILTFQSKMTEGVFHFLSLGRKGVQNAPEHVMKLLLSRVQLISFS